MLALLHVWGYTEYSNYKMRRAFCLWWGSKSEMNGSTGEGRLQKAGSLAKDDFQVGAGMGREYTFLKGTPEPSFQDS